MKSLIDVALLFVIRVAVDADDTNPLLFKPSLSNKSGDRA